MGDLYPGGGGGGSLTDHVANDIDAGVNPIAAVINAIHVWVLRELAVAGGTWKSDGESTWLE